MARKHRNFKFGQYYHIYNRGNRKETIFWDRSDREYFLRKANKILMEINHDILLAGYCLMDNHYHLALREGSEYSISKLMQCLITSYTQHFNGKYKTVGHVFQGRFQSTHIPNKRALELLLKYFQQNPVKSGYVRNSDHYSWLHCDGVKPSAGQTPVLE